MFSNHETFPSRKVVATLAIAVVGVGVGVVSFLLFFCERIDECMK